jgi:hypothetical protein
MRIYNPVASDRAKCNEKGATAKQKQLLHVLPAQLGMSDAERRAFIAERVGGKTSAADLTHREATLVLDRLFEMARGQNVATWRADGPTRFELAKLQELRAALGGPRFDGLARRIAQGESDPGRMNGRQARALLEAAKAILAREAVKSER